MATDFKLPDLGENIASGDVVSVFVSPGDVVKPGQALLEVETDKAVIEVPC
ncbi:MAG: branched-chain alpha-keto acid dehydrogenase subunit E2, partial [Planctomycetaceae bacterium]|nr:branched-chain alpha-keto acid dehydrogenase subunit E2 [Planctomycetaceae bacterium]